MQLASDIAVSLAAACGRFLVRRYLKEAADVPGETLLDIAKRQLTDVRQQREVARVFEDFSDRIVAQIWSSLEGRLKSHPALDLNAVAREIAETLHRPIPADLVTRRHLEAAPLNAAYVAARTKPSLPVPEGKAYDLMLAESLRYIVEVSAALPRFELPQASECLKRLKTSGEDVDKALQTVKLIEHQVIDSQGLEVATKEQRWEADYRQAVIRELDRVDLFGADLPAEAKRNLLTDAFVTLNINQKVKHRRMGSQPVLSSSEQALTLAEIPSPPSAPSDASVPSDFPPNAPDISLDDDTESDKPEADAPDEEYLGLLSSEAVFDQLGFGEKGRLLIRGSAGMGKTTLMRWAAINAARADRSLKCWGVLSVDTVPDGFLIATVLSPEQLIGTREFIRGFERRDPEFQTAESLFRRVGLRQDLSESYASQQLAEVVVNRVWRSQVPFLIPLRHCQSGRLPTPGNFPLVIAEIAKATGQPPAEWVEQVLNDGRALVLIDGVDEVPNENRAAIRDELQALINAYPDNQFVVTTRPEAVPDGWLADLHFDEARIAPLAESDVHKFIRLWHEAVEKELARRGRPAGEIREVGERLIEKLRNTPGLFFLAANPLLCAMICAMHHDRGQKLPEGQYELCETLTRMLLHSREREGGLEWQQFPAAYRDLTYPQKRRMVQDLAVVMVLEELSALPYEVALKRVEHSLSGLGRTPADAAIVLTSLVERSGMLREPNPDSIDFIHNTFKEFLAGEAFGSGESVAFRSAKGRPFAERKATLAERVLGSDSVTAQESWRRIALFAAATKSSCANEMIEFALTGLDEIPDREAQTRRIVFAMQCERVADDAAAVIEPGTRERLRSHKTPAHLRPQSFSEAEQLALLGDAAVEFLGCLLDESTDETTACIRTLRLINTAAARKVCETHFDHTKLPVVVELSQFVNPLILPSVQNFVQTMPIGRRIPVGVRSRITDLSPLATAPDWLVAKAINLSRTAIRDVSALANLTELQLLSLHGTQVSDISPLARLTALRYLSLRSTQVSDIRTLARLTGLQKLYLDRTPVCDFNPLASLTSLTFLSLSGTQVTDLGPLASLAGLQQLNLRGTPISDLRPLSNLTAITSLNLIGTRVSDLIPLTNLTALKTLYLNGTPVSDISLLASLTELTNLYLIGTHVSDITPLAGNKKLKIIGLDEIQARSEELARASGVSLLSVHEETAPQSGDPDARLVGAPALHGQAAEDSWLFDRLDIANFRGFERREFPIRSRVTVLIGNNATGKTSAIEAFSLALGAFARGFDAKSREIDNDRDVHVSPRTEEPQYPVSIRATGRMAGEVLDWIRVLELADGQPVERDEMVAWSRAQRMQRQVRNGEPVTLPVFAVFPSSRRISMPPLGPLETLPPGSRLQGYLNWQQPLEDLRPFVLWLKTRVLEAQQTGTPPLDLLAVQAAVGSAFEEAMFPRGIGILPVAASSNETNSPPVNDDGGSNENGDRQDAYPTEIQLTSIDWNIRQNRPEAVFSDGTRQRLGLLSDGQVGFLAIIAEIARRAATLNPHFGDEAAAKSPGIVLIDELDLHIHPRWQRTLIGDLKRTFPLMQFIIATHSALIVQQLQGDELINLDPDPPGNQDFRKLSAEEVLEDVMGNDNTKRSQHFNTMQSVAARYYELLEQRPDGDEEVAALKRELDRLIAPFSDDPAFHAFLERKRQRAGLGE